MFTRVTIAAPPRWCAALLLALFVLLSAGPAPAQSLPGAGLAQSSNEATPQERTAALEDLIVSIESDTGREKLLEQLRTLVEAQRAGAEKPAARPESEPRATPVFDMISEKARLLGEALIEGAAEFARAPALLAWIGDRLEDPAARARVLQAIFKIAGAIAAAVAADFIMRRLLRGPRRALRAHPRSRGLARAFGSLGVAVIDLLPLAILWVTAEFILGLLNPVGATLVVARLVVAATVAARGVLLVSRLILAPSLPLQRLVPLDDESAHYAHIWVRRFAVIGIFGYALIVMAAALKLSAGGVAALQLLLMLILGGLAIALILQMRVPVRRLIRGTRGTDTVPGARRIAAARARLADIWHVLAIIYVLGVFSVWLLDVDGGLMTVGRATGLTVLAIVVASMAQVGAKHLLSHLLAPNEGVSRAYPHLEYRAGRYLPIVHVAVRVLIWLAAFVAVTEAWGVESFEWLTSAQGRTAIGTIVQIALVLLLAVFVHEASSAAIERYIHGRSSAAAMSGRVRTLLPLLRNVIRIAVILITTLIVLSEIGINIGPLLAGAGVIGLAIGFGSQKLVQDIINGIFIMIEDTVSIGDVVSVAGKTGLCEGITVRSITLRDLDGTVYTVPFSEVSVVSNLTKDFSLAVMEVGVAYRENTDEVVKVLHEVAESLRKDETYGPLVLEPLEVLGVDAFADSAVIIKIRLKTPPAQQWSVKREFNRRMKMAFDREGIEIPFPHQTIFFGEAKGGGAPPAFVELVTAAKEAEPKKPKTSNPTGPSSDAPAGAPIANTPPSSE